jgi:hypothetical protein
MAGTRAKALAMQAAYGYWRPLLSCSSLPTKVRLLMVQTFIYSAVMWRGSVGHDEGGQRQDVSGRKALRSILACIPETAPDVLARGHWATSTRCTH